jgi:hypothetical protein
LKEIKVKFEDEEIGHLKIKTEEGVAEELA